MSRNFGLGSREMAKAGQFACNASARAGTMSYASAATLGERWCQFSAWAREAGIQRMEDVDRPTVEAYGRELAEAVAAGERSAAYAQNLVSAVNTVMDLATRGGWERVSPTRDCAIAQRCTVREDAPAGHDRGRYDQALAELRTQGLDRQAVIAELARELGLRSKEASLLDARQALAQAMSRDQVTITAGTKGGRSRELPILAERQLEVLARAAEIQGPDRSLVPAAQIWAQWRDGGLRDGREALQAQGLGGYHDLRAGYACERYEAFTGQAAPVLGGTIQDRETDRAARSQVAAELGHDRIDVVSQYIGGRR